MTDLSFSPENQMELFKLILYVHSLPKCDDLQDEVWKLPTGLYNVTIHCKHFIQHKSETTLPVQVKKEVTEAFKL